MLNYRGSLPRLAGRDCGLDCVAFDGQSILTSYAQGNVGTSMASTSHTMYTSISTCYISESMLTQVELCRFNNVRAKLKLPNQKLSNLCQMTWNILRLILYTGTTWFTVVWCVVVKANESTRAFADTAPTVKVIVKVRWTICRRLSKIT